MERALNSPLPEHGAPARKAGEGASAPPRHQQHLPYRRAGSLVLALAVACSAAAVWWALPYQLVFVPSSLPQGLEEDHASCGEECSRDEILALAAKQVNAARGREALLRGDLKAMSSKASLLPDAVAQAEECSRQLKLNENVCKERRKDLEATVAQHTHVFKSCASLSDQNHRPPEDLPRQAEAGCAEAAASLKRWQSLERKLEEREKVLDAITGRGEACWGNLHHAKEEVRKWQLRCATISLVCLVLSGSVIGFYKRWLTRKMWRWTAEKARLGAALKLAEAGLTKSRRKGD